MPAGREEAVYNRKGYDPALADPAVQRELRGQLDKRGIPDEAASEAISRSADGPPPKQQGGGGNEQRFKIPKGGKTIPGVGKMKEGETVIYNPETGKYRRG